MTDIAYEQTSVQPCELCNDGMAILRMQQSNFPYGIGPEQVMLQAQVPTWVCESCHGTYHGEGTEDAEHDAVCDHLDRLRPSAIRGLRLQLGMNQREFGDHTGIGVASIKRWESGAQIQTKAFDNLLRFYRDQPGRIGMPSARNWGQPVFRTHIPRERHAAAAVFELAA